MPPRGRLPGPTTYGRSSQSPPGVYGRPADQEPGVYGRPRQAVPPEPAPRRRTRSKRRDPWWARLLVVMGSLLMLASGGSIVGTKLLVAQATKSLNTVNVTLPDQTGKVVFDGPINILLAGIDTRNNPGELIRSDTIMLVHIPASHDQAFVVSIPRDTDAEIPAYKPTGFGGGRYKINAAFAFGSQNKGGWSGGLQLLAETIKLNYGIAFQAAAVIDFDGFQKVIQALGGVHMCVDEKVTSIHIGLDSSGHFKKPFVYDGGAGAPIPVPGVKPQVYLPGCYDMPAWQALDYARQREGLPHGDYDRQRHQQQLIKAMIKKATSAGVLTNPVKLNKVIQAAGSAVTVSLGGASILDWAFTLRNVGDNSMVMIKTNGGKFDPVTVNGESREKLSPESLQLFEAVKDDAVADFIVSHPDWVSKDA
ncbi:MAG TPA: LCP family protein [Micromonosporaceae bacterium]